MLSVSEIPGRGRVPAALLALAVLATTAAADPFFDFHGYSYLDGPAFTVGTRVSVPTRFNEIQPDPVWPLDLVANEYTVMVSDLVIASVLVAGPIRTVTFSGGGIGIYRDAARNSAFAANPPNAAVPATFTDGVAELSGGFAGLVMIWNTLSGTGTVSGDVVWTGGARFGDLPAADGWTYFGGVSNHAGLGIPAGYDLAWDPQLYGQSPTPTESSSWGRVKNLFAGDR